MTNSDDPAATAATAPAEANGASSPPRTDKLPQWHYSGIAPDASQLQAFDLPALSGPSAMDLGAYCRSNVSNADTSPLGRQYFDFGLRLMLSYQHEMASKCFLACLQHAPDCALAHGCVALCHSPNYNFRGQAYYESACHPGDVNLADELCVFPSQQVADRHAVLGMRKVEELKKRFKVPKGKKKKKQSTLSAPAPPVETTAAAATNGTDEAPPTVVPSTVISDVETQLLSAIRILTSCPGVDSDLAEETVGRPYADAMRKVFANYPDDPDVAYCFAESLMVLNAWQLYEYPSGKPVSPDVVETRAVLEGALAQHPAHAGLCHLYVHLSEMSADPAKALKACSPLRHAFPHAGHLIHMPTHIDVLVGDYESCVRSNLQACRADAHVRQVSPLTAGPQSFYFGYCVHNYHMAVYGCILGGFEKKALQVAEELNAICHEALFTEYPDLVAYLETYAALEVHTLIRFGQWQRVLELDLPQNKTLMLYRTCSILFGRALALAATGHVEEALKEADRLDSFRACPEAAQRILHNNSVKDLLQVDATMVRGEIAYRQGKYSQAFSLLRKAVAQQDALNYDEPWGKMQPIRHALGGLLLEQGHVEEAAQVFRQDLQYHPKNPWALVGLIQALQKESTSSSCCSNGGSGGDVAEEIATLKEQLAEQRKGEWADYEVVVACECCQHKEE